MTGILYFNQRKQFAYKLNTNPTYIQVRLSNLSRTCWFSDYHNHRRCRHSQTNRRANPTSPWDRLAFLSPNLCSAQHSQKRSKRILPKRARQPQNFQRKMALVVTRFWRSWSVELSHQSRGHGLRIRRWALDGQVSPVTSKGKLTKATSATKTVQTPENQSQRWSCVRLSAWARDRKGTH